MTQEPPGRGIRFRESMPRPLLIVFVVAAVAAAGLVIWLVVSPPVPNALDLGARRSPPSGAFTHDVVRVVPAPVPTPIADLERPCDALAGVRVEGGPAAQNRIVSVFERLCVIEADPKQPAELKQAIRTLGKATIRFAIFTRTGEQSTADVSRGKIYINVDLARTSVDPIVIAPLLVHEGWHLSAMQLRAFVEFEARVAELQACEVVFAGTAEPPRGCLDAQAIVALGEARAVEEFARAGYAR